MADDAATGIYREIGRRIAATRRQRKPRLSQKDLAEAVDLSRTSVVNIERGRHRIQIHVLYVIAQMLGVEPHDLLPPLVRGDDGAALPTSFMKLLLPKEQAAVKRLVTHSGGSSS